MAESVMGLPSAKVSCRRGGSPGLGAAVWARRCGLGSVLWLRCRRSGEHPIRKLVNVTHAGDSAHDSVNPGQTPARFVLAAFEPGVGPSRRSEGTGV